MKKTEKENKTSKEAKKAGLKRIKRKHLAPKGETNLSDCKVRITINLDADVLEYFKQRAESPNSAPYQTQINAELRRIMETDNSPDSLDSAANDLLQNPRFISALKDKLKAA
jgi:uncharacterized protein (DUF4415 family)